MRFSVAILVPLTVLIAPVLSGTVKKTSHKSEHKGAKHVKGNHHKGRDNSGDVDAWKPTWTFPGSGKQCPSDVKKDCPCLTDSECRFQCPKKWPDTDCTWDTVFENKSNWSGWKLGKYTLVTTGYVSKDTFELDYKNLCSAHEKCTSCQVLLAFSVEEAAEEFICALFEELIDTSTWEEDCNDDKDSKNAIDMYILKSFESKDLNMDLNMFTLLMKLERNCHHNNLKATL
ncbi:hypothetical protein EDD18DRAFT_1329245 [Armillaria luteobubalina]|uniref:Uncharacterized protein n=1 Tax=Armillaria luteobubalina TaxID=153913 RepID=A0AA39V016_9AGAR|nr:hypothetical protein EDD18DRAFT_1329245 [Armillaria luteobubalina]